MAAVYSLTDGGYIFLAIAVMTLFTMALRFAPFLVFRQKAPKTVLYLGKVLPEAVMAMLVVYCLKHVSFVSGTHGFPEIIAMALVIGLHKWKHNTLLSILVGTLAYMALVQVVFPCLNY